MLNLLFSVVIPVYNAQEYLSECIESVLYQSYDNWELILVNDGSTDRSIDICKVYTANHKSIKLIDKENEGVVKAREDGVKNSKGDYVLFLDSDDFLDVETLSLFSQAIHTGNEIVITKNFYSVKDKNSILISKKKCDNTPSSLIAMKYALEGIALSSLCGNAYPKKFLEFNRKFPDLRIGEDLMTNLSIIVSFKPQIFILEEAVYYYRENSLSVMHVNDQRKMASVYQLCKCLETFVLENNLCGKLKKEYSFRMILLWSNFIFNNYTEIRNNTELRKKYFKFYLSSFFILHSYLKFYILVDFFSPKLLDTFLNNKKLKK